LPHKTAVELRVLPPKPALEYVMLRYPVDISEENPGEFVAKLADAPKGPVARGDSADAAFRSLMDPAITYLTKLMMKGKAITPSEENGRPILGVDMPQRMIPTYKPEVLRKDSGKMINYSWTPSVVYRER